MGYAQMNYANHKQNIQVTKDCPSLAQKEYSGKTNWGQKIWGQS
jgi:hypothetical protein